MAVRAVATAPLIALLPTSGQQPVPPAVRYEQHVFAGGAAPAAETLENPFKSDRRSAVDGEKLFSAFNCDGCHSLGATGGEGPSLADGRWRYGGADGAIFQSIYYGRPRGLPALVGVRRPDAARKRVACP